MRRRCRVYFTSPSPIPHSPSGFVRPAAVHIPARLRRAFKAYQKVRAQASLARTFC